MPNQSTFGEILSSNNKAVYEMILDTASKGSDPRYILNHYPWQSRLAIRKLFENARDGQKEIRMLTGTAGRHHFRPEILDAFEASLKAGCKSRILVWQKDFTHTSPELLELNERYSNLTVKCSDTATSRNSEELPHFQLSGINAYRQEKAHEPITDSSKVTDSSPPFPARINFNDPENGQKMCEFFEFLWN